jgi:hypothetical protein
MKFRAHCPGFVDGFTHPGVSGTLAEILADPWVHSWSQDANFHRWSLSDNCLIAEQNGGDKQWVVGYLDPPPIGELPEWVESDFGRIRREAWNRGVATVNAMEKSLRERTY